MKRQVVALLVGVLVLALQVAAVPQTERPRVLFDEYHDERNSISLDRARNLDPKHPEWYSYQQLRTELEDWYRVEQGITPLTESLLESIDVLVLAVPQRSFSAHELAATKSFVESGGGLLLLGDAFPPQPLNDIASVFGVRFLPGAIASRVPEWDAQSFLAGYVDGLDEITKWAQPFCANWASALELPAAALALVRTQPNTWQDLNGDGVQSANEKPGPFVLAAALVLGKGRMVAISDNAFQDSMVDIPGNRTLVTKTVAWLSRLAAPEPQAGALRTAADLASITAVGTLPFGRAEDPLRWPDLFAAFHIEFLDLAHASNSIGFYTDERAMRWIQTLGIPASSYLSQDPQNLPGWSLRTRYYDFLPEDELWRNPDGSVARDPFESSAARTIGGSTMVSEGGDFVVMSECSPYWQDYQLESIDWAISLGLDAIYIDLPDRVPLRLGSDFSDWSVAAFRDYLAAHYVSSKLATWGIGNVQAFDIQQYISGVWVPRAVNTTSGTDGGPVFFMSPYDAPLSDPIIRAFHEFEYSTHIDYFRGLVEHAHSAGLASGRFVPYFGNLWIGWAGDLLTSANPTVLLGQVMDLIEIEMLPAIPPAERIVPAVKLALAMGKHEKPVWVWYRGFYGWPGEPAVLPPDPMVGALRLFIAESYAAGGIPELPLGGFMGLDGRGLALDEEGQPLPGLVSVMDFVWQNKDLFLDRHPFSRVALVYSASSFLWHDLPLFGIGYNVEREVFAACARALEEAHIQYDVVIFGHPGLWDDARELASLSQYSAVVLPAVTCISDRQIDALTSFVRGGGKLIGVGLPDRTEEYQQRSSPAFSDLLRDSGRGQLVALDIGTVRAYYSQMGSRSGAGLAELIQPLTREKELISTTAPATVGINAWRNKSGFTLHLVNYDYSIATDSLAEASGIAFTLDIRELGLPTPTRVTYYSADRDSAEQLAFYLVGDALEFVIPAVGSWGIVEVR